MSMKSFWIMSGVIFGLILLVSCTLRAHAQVTTSPTNGTISVTNTFQNVLVAQNGGRLGCTIQNQGTHTMYVFFGPIGSATLAKSLQVVAGQTISCGVLGGNSTVNLTAQDSVNLTGTAGDAYVVNAQ